MPETVKTTILLIYVQIGVVLGYKYKIEILYSRQAQDLDYITHITVSSLSSLQPLTLSQVWW